MLHGVKYANTCAFSGTYFPVYILEFFQENLAQRKQCPTESIGKFRYNILFSCTCKILCMKRQTCSTDIFQFFFMQPKVTVYIFGRVTIHFLSVNTEYAKFQSNFTGFKFVSGADIRFETFKTA